MKQHRREQYIAVTTGLGGGREDIHAPHFGNALYVFTHPDKTEHHGPAGNLRHAISS